MGKPYRCRQLLEVEGILAGSSSGTLIAAALKYCRAQTNQKMLLPLSVIGGINISLNSTTIIGCRITAFYHPLKPVICAI